MGDPEFGSKLDGMDYMDRPGAYAIIENDHKQVAVIETGNGYFLPGGGMDAGETEIEALERELIEETGYQISGIVQIAAAVEYIKAAQEEKYYQIRSRFYRARLASKIGKGLERDHRLMWLSPEDALKLLTRQGQVWALQRVIGDQPERTAPG